MELVKTWSEGHAAWIEIHRPDRLNALNHATLQALQAAVSAAAEEPETHVILLVGAGERAFAAGADIAEMNAQTPDGVRALMEAGKAVTRLLESAPQPVVAVVNGYALGGGCELALACDLILASENAQFALPEVDLGILTGWGGSQRLARRVGYGRAREIIFTGRRVRAAEALQLGLCEHVYPLASLRAEAASLAAVLAAKDPQALAAAKRALSFQSQLSFGESLACETDLFVDLFDRPERQAAMGKFLNRGGS